MISIDKRKTQRKMNSMPTGSSLRKLSENADDVCTYTRAEWGHEKTN